MKKILITGGNGFIGCNLIYFLLGKKKFKLLNIDTLSYASNKNINTELQKNSNYSFRKININNFTKIKSAIEGFKPCIVFHLAAETHVDNSIKNSDKFIKSNINGTHTLVKASYEYWKNLDQRNGKKFKFIHISTDEVFGDLGPKSKPSTEISRYLPSSPYSASKASSDHIVRAWYKTYEFPIIITNCSNNYGPYQFEEKLIPLTINHCLNLKKIPIYGNGLQKRDWIYVDDHIRALYKLMTLGKIGESYNIGSNSNISNLEVVNIICQELNNILPLKNQKCSDYRDLITFVIDRKGHDKRYQINVNKIKKLTNWKPLVNLSSGISKTVNWYIKKELHGKSP